MTRRASVLCPVDFSPPSRSALRYAAAVAEHFGAEFIVMTVSDPLLTEVAELRMGVTALSGASSESFAASSPTRSRTERRARWSPPSSLPPASQLRRFCGWPANAAAT